MIMHNKGLLRVVLLNGANESVPLVKVNDVEVPNILYKMREGVWHHFHLLGFIGEMPEGVVASRIIDIGVYPINPIRPLGKDAGYSRRVPDVKNARV